MSEARTQRRVYRYAFILALVLAGVVGIVLVAVDRTTALAVKLSAVGTGLVTSIIFTTLFAALANREFSELQRVEIDRQFTALSDKLLTEVRDLNKLHLPSDGYPATSDFDRGFNVRLTGDLTASSFYLFRGTSGKYVAARVRSANKNFSFLRIVVLDPTLPRVLLQRAWDRKRNLNGDGRSDHQLVEELRNEIYMSVVALFDCRAICPVEIGYATETSVVRVEMLEHALYTSPYLSEQSSRETFPETLRYPRESILYDVYRMDLSRQYDLCDSRVRFTNADADDVLIQHLRTVGFDGASSESLARLRASYQEFARPFRRMLEAQRR